MLSRDFLTLSACPRWSHPHQLQLPSVPGGFQTPNFRAIYTYSTTHGSLKLNRTKNELIVFPILSCSFFSASEQSIHLTIKHSLCQALGIRHRMSYFHSRAVNSSSIQLAAQGGDLGRIPSSLFPSPTALGTPCSEFHLNPFLCIPMDTVQGLISSCLYCWENLLAFRCLVWLSLLMPGHF